MRNNGFTGTQGVLGRAARHKGTDGTADARADWHAVPDER